MYGCLHKNSEKWLAPLTEPFSPTRECPLTETLEPPDRIGRQRELLSEARQPEVDIPEQWLRPNFQLNRPNNS